MIDQLVEISRYYGRLKGYALGGGGNTSYKNDETLWVKASGYSLAEITEDGFAELSRKSLKKISFKKYSADPFKREQQVKDDLIAANINPGKKLRPSVEASLHELIEYSFVVHTHPYLVNALTCSKNAKRMIMKLFGTGALYVPYVDPGYILFKKIERDLVKYKKEHKHHPRIIFLQNHGVFVGANTIKEIKSVYRQVFDKIKNSMHSHTITGRGSGRVKYPAKILEIYKNHNGGLPLVIKSKDNALVSHYTKDIKNAWMIAKPFIPDQIVYCRSYPLWLREKELNKPEFIEKKFSDYNKKHGFLPRIILLENAGMLGIEINDRSAELVLDVFEDAMKIGYYSKSFGGPHFMNNRQIAFIENWEVENYRRNLLVK